MFSIEQLRGWALQGFSNLPDGILKLHFFNFEKPDKPSDSLMRRAELLALGPKHVAFCGFRLKEGRSPICTDIQLTGDDLVLSVVVKLEIGEVQIERARKLEVLRY
jgi:hypothetical protein